MARGYTASIALLCCCAAQIAHAAELQPKPVGTAPLIVEQSTAVPAPSTENGLADYRLAPRDLVQFQIFEETELLTVQRVSASGEITVPMLNTVKVGGKSLREAEQMLNRLYVDKGFFVKPQVIISLQTYAPRNVSVLGQVNKPDQIEFPVESEHLSLVRAITSAGGFTQIARTDAVRINRRVDGHDENITVNVEQFLASKTSASSDFQLLAGDVVFVPERTF